MKLDSRKYVDLIYKAESKFANWEPSRVIKAGDYGTFDIETGELNVVGNIYKNEDIRNITERYALICDGIVDHQSVHSSRATQCDFDVSADASLADITNAQLKLQFGFSNRRGALLVMHQHQATRVPDNLLDELTKIDYLKEKVLVTRVINCPGYVRYLSSKHKENLGIALIAGLPTGMAPSGGMSLQWQTSAVSGNLQLSYHEGTSYTPLFYAKQIQQPMWRRTFNRRRASPDPYEREDDYWIDAHVPWDTLDDNGLELKVQYKVHTETESEGEDETENSANQTQV